MIYIDLSGKAPPAEWIVEADNLTARLLEAADDDERFEIIDNNEATWKDLRGWLSEQSDGKCWYSEARDCASYWHVDHFRPKGDVKDFENKKIVDGDGEELPGYWWLAFKWQNYRLGGSAVNTPKSSIFPIRDERVRATDPIHDENDESPFLLDPTRVGDPGLISFHEKGHVVPGDPTGAWNRQRFEVSRKVYNLDFDFLVRGRQTCWTKCDEKITRLRILVAELQNKASRDMETKIDGKFDELREMTDRSAPFSAVAVTCIRSKGLGWLERGVFG